MNIGLRSNCKCGGIEGEIRATNGQNCVYCLDCGRFQYNAPKTETGDKARTIATSHESIKPKTRAKILMRATGRCEICGKTTGVLHVGHLLSVEDGIAYGLKDSEINCEENLACMCEECNLGIGKESVPLRLAAAIIVRRNSMD